MWYGKVALIMWIFSFGCLLSFYYTNQVLNFTPLNNNQNTSLNDLTALANSFNLTTGINSNLIFGDFITGVTVFFQIVTGQVIADAFTIIPFIGTNELLIIHAVFGSASAVLWVFIIANRSL